MENTMKNNERGITLVSLVITVIILSILAGVLLSLDARNDDVINIANQKKSETEQMMLEENIKIELSENPPDSYNELIQFLKNYGNIENETEPDNATLITTKGNYAIKVNEIWNVNAKSIGINIGDYVEYEFDGGTYTIDSNIIGNSNELSITINYDQNIKWRVINVDEQNNTVEIIPININMPQITLSGENGFNNAVKTLNDLCNTIFSNTEEGISARSINLADIEKMGQNINALKGSSFGTEKSYGRANYPYVILPETNNNMQSEIYIGDATSSNLVTKQTYYSGEIVYNKNSYINLLPYGTYWLASRCINNGNNAEFRINTISLNTSPKVDASKLYESSRANAEATSGILPVVVLENKKISDGDGQENSPYKITE